MTDEYLGNTPPTPPQRSRRNLEGRKYFKVEYAVLIPYTQVLKDPGFLNSNNGATGQP